MPADSVHLIRDQALCGRAGRAYLDGARPARGVHRVVLVQVGARYITIDVNQIGRSGEFMNEALLDRALRVVGWLMT